MSPTFYLIPGTGIQGFYALRVRDAANYARDARRTRLWIMSQRTNFNRRPRPEDIAFAKRRIALARRSMERARQYARPFAV